MLPSKHSQEIAKFIIFPFLLCCLLYGTQRVLLAGLRRCTTGDNGLWNKIVFGKINADLLILGSSRALVHFDPVVLKAQTNMEGFNVGRNGTAIDMQLALLRVYLRHNRQPKCLILALDPFTLDPLLDLDSPGQYVAYLDEPDLASALYRRNRIWKIYKYFPLIGICAYRLQQSAIRGLVGQYPPESSQNGFLPQHKEWGPEFDQFRKQHPDGVKFAIEPTKVASLRQLLQLCRQLHIIVVMVYPPEYIEFQTITLNRGEIFSTYAKLAEEFHTPFWDYSGDPICQDEQYFYNSQHLNAKGAAVFSDEVALRLQQMRTHSSADIGADIQRGK